MYKVDAQQLPQFRHNIFSNFYYNPAYACDPNKPEIILNHRSQWTGFEGSPTTSSFSGSYMFRDDMAGGLIIMNDKTGPTQRLMFNLSYAYLLEINKSWKLSCGLSWTLMQSKIDGSMIDLYDDSDELVFENISDHIWKPDANAGIMIFNNKYYAGFSVMQLFKSKYRLYRDGDAGIDAVRHYFISSGARIEMGRSSTSVINPTFNIEMVANSPFTFDIGLMWEYKNSFLSGLTYSYRDAISMNVGYKYQNFTFIYSYDIVTSQLMCAAKGAHEITLAYDLNLGSSSHYQPMF